jgi:hypothetical protein
MRIHDPRVFGAHIKSLREEGLVTVNDMAKATEMDPDMYRRLEAGMIGSSITGEMIDVLVEAIPGLSLATSPGVFPPSISPSKFRGDS